MDEAIDSKYENIIVPTESFNVHTVYHCWQSADSEKLSTLGMDIQTGSKWSPLEATVHSRQSHKTSNSQASVPTSQSGIKIRIVLTPQSHGILMISALQERVCVFFRSEVNPQAIAI